MKAQKIQGNQQALARGLAPAATFSAACRVKHPRKARPFGISFIVRICRKKTRIFPVHLCIGGFHPAR
jgi:hypothetical protein